MGLWCRLALMGLLGSFVEVAAEVSTLHFGGTAGAPWSEWTLLDLMVEDTTPALQPLGVKARRECNHPIALTGSARSTGDLSIHSGAPACPDMAGHGHIIAGIAVPKLPEVIDGDVNTAFVDVIMPAGEVFFTLDMGSQIPAERFVVVPPEGWIRELRYPIVPSGPLKAMR